MPELPEVETVVQGLHAPLLGQRLKQVDQRRLDLRFPLPVNFAARLEGRRVVRLARRAKYILAHLDDGIVWLTHLGMSGRLYVHDDADWSPGPHDHVVVTTERGRIVVFQDHRRFGFMDLIAEDDLERHRMLRNLGPEPLSNAFNGAVLSQTLAGRRTPIKAALLDQRNVAGLGNIYVCEALYRARISPRRLARSVAGVRAERLVPAIRAVLQEAIAAGGSSLRDYVQANGELGYFQHNFDVYGREGEACRRCGGSIRRIVQSGRSSFYCGGCQR